MKGEGFKLDGIRIRVLRWIPGGEGDVRWVSEESGRRVRVGGGSGGICRKSCTFFS